MIVQILYYSNHIIDANIVFSNFFFIRLHLTLVSDQTENAEG